MDKCIFIRIYESNEKENGKTNKQQENYCC